MVYLNEMRLDGIGKVLDNCFVLLDFIIFVIM